MISIASFKKVGLGALFGVFALATAASAAFVSPQNVKVDYTSIAPQSIRVTWQSGGGTGSNFLVRKSRDGQIYQSTAFVGSNVSSYTFNDLSANTQYWFHVSSGDDVGVESPVVTVGPVYSGTFAPRAPTITNLTNNSLRISITPADGNPPSTTYFVREIEATGGLYVQANGTLGSNYYVDTAAGWGSKLISGLNADTKYVFVAVSKNSEGINSNGSPHAQATTAGALMTPNPPQVTDYGTTTVVMRLVPDANTGSVQYGIQDSATGAWLQPNGSMGTASFLNWLNDWGTITIHGLKPNTLYNYRTIVQDTGTGMTKQSPATAIYTAADVPTNVKVASQSQTQATISWTGNASTYQVQNLTGNTSSNWQKATTYTMNVTCGKSYQMRVRGENVVGLVTGYSSTLTFKSMDCPAPAPVPKPVTPTPPPVVITPTTPPPVIAPTTTTSTVDHPSTSPEPIPVTPINVIPQPSGSANSTWWMWLLLPIGLVIGLVASLVMRRRQ